MSGLELKLNDRSQFKRSMNAGLELDPKSTAVLTIDLQRKYLDPEIGESTVDSATEARVMQACETLLTYARRWGIPVIHAYVVRRPEELAGPYPRGMLPYIRAAAEIGVSQLPHREVQYRPDRTAGSLESEVMPTLLGAGDIHLQTKKTWDCFQYTDLDHLLRWSLGVDTLLIAGVNTETCVYSTVFSAGNRGYRSVVISDCVGSMRGSDNHLMALELMARSVAWVLTLEEVFAKLVCHKQQTNAVY